MDILDDLVEQVQEVRSKHFLLGRSIDSVLSEDDVEDFCVNIEGEMEADVEFFDTKYLSLYGSKIIDENIAGIVHLGRYIVVLWEPQEGFLQHLTHELVAKLVPKYLPELGQQEMNLFMERAQHHVEIAGSSTLSYIGIPKIKPLCYLYFTSGEKTWVYRRDLNKQPQNHHVRVFSPSDTRYSVIDCDHPAFPKYFDSLFPPPIEAGAHYISENGDFPSSLFTDVSALHIRVDNTFLDQYASLMDMDSVAHVVMKYVQRLFQGAIRQGKGRELLNEKNVILDNTLSLQEFIA
ncbi:MAG: hypothetical protein ACE5FT_05120 [Candidatus Nanoarchaeia archaeon]